MTEDFEQKAIKLISKLNNLNGSVSGHNESSSIPKQKISNSLSQIEAFQHQMEASQQQKSRKSHALQSEISKLQNYLVDENQARSTISKLVCYYSKGENFINTANKVQKNMCNAFASISKSFQEKEKKITIKIQELVSNQMKQIDTNLTQNQNLILNIQSLSEQVTALQNELQQMKKSRYVLEDKIYKQFVDQLRQLKNVHQRDIRERQERQASIVDCIKEIYTSILGQIRKEQLERQVNQKGFLTVIQQVIDRIVQQ